MASRQTRVPGQYIVTLLPGADVKVITDVYGQFGIRGVRDLGQGLFLVTLTQDPGPAAMEEMRIKDPQIKAVQPNFIYRIDKPLQVR